MSVQDQAALEWLTNAAEALRAAVALGEADGWGSVLGELRGALSAVEHVIREAS